MSEPFHVLGRHVIAEYYGCDPQLLDDLDRLSDLLFTAALRSGATPIKREFHHFSPYGVSGVVIITESHLTIHTWPEHRYAAVDFFTCGEKVDPDLASAFLGEALGATRTRQETLRRGLQRASPERVGNRWRVRTEASGGLSDDQGDPISAARVDRVLHAGRTSFAQVEIVESRAFGKMLAVDGNAVSAGSDEASYHEALVVPAFALSSGPLRRVAILGGGGGATLREVLRFPEVERCVMVDIDRELVELCRTHLPEWSAGAFDDPRAEICFDGAKRFLERAAAGSDAYDLIIADLPEAEIGGPVEALDSAAAFVSIASCLAPGGLYAGQVGRLDRSAAVLGAPAILGAAGALGAVHPYSRFIPSSGAEWVFAVACRTAPLSLSPAEIDARLAERRDARWPCRTYDGVTHQRLFSLPKDLRAALSASAER